MPGVTFLLQSQTADWTTGHLGRDSEMVQHVTHQSLIILESLGTDGAHQLVKVIAACHYDRNIKLLAHGADHFPHVFGGIRTRGGVDRYRR